MDRRAFIGTLTGVLLAAPLAAEAQRGNQDQCAICTANLELAAT
jgi:hypothetical protein